MLQTRVHLLINVLTILNYLIPKETIEQIKTAMDIVEVVGDFVELKRSGSSFKALSPFTDEKTPSFMVSPSKGIYKCFSTGNGGDAIKFIMEVEGMNYVEALKFLAQKYGIEIQEEEQSQEQKESQSIKESIYVALEFAKNEFVKNLNETPDGKAIGLSYFKERGFNVETIEKFQLGYSLKEWDGLLKSALKNQFKEEILEKSGLIIKKENKTYDRFRERVIFPIHNITGKVVAFGARTLSNDKKQPKYINSPETEVYHKSHVLYGAFQAKQAIRQEENCLLVEGYTDVISLHQAGIENVVASSGTSLTIEQIRLIKRYSKNITVLYDGDKAGIKASVRGIDLILEEDLNVSAINLPEGEDPDSFVRSLGESGFRAYIEENRLDFISFITKVLLEDTDDDPFKVSAVIKDIVESISKIPDPIKRSVFFKKCSELLKIDEAVLIQEYNKVIINKRRSASKSTPHEESYIQPPELETPVIDEVTPASILKDQEGELIRILLNYGDQLVEEEQRLSEYLITELDDTIFTHPIYRKIIELYQSNMTLDLPYFIGHEDQEIQKVSIDFAATRYEISESWEKKHQVFVKKEEEHLADTAFKMVLRLKRRFIKLKIEELQNALKETKEDEITEVIVKLIRLKSICKQIDDDLNIAPIG